MEVSYLVDGNRLYHIRQGSEVVAGRVLHRTVQVATGGASSSGVIHADSVAPTNLVHQPLPTKLTVLGERAWRDLEPGILSFTSATVLVAFRLG